MAEIVPLPCNSAADSLPAKNIYNDILRWKVLSRIFAHLLSFMAHLTPLEKDFLEILKPNSEMINSIT